MNPHNSGSTSEVTVAATATLVKAIDIEPRIATALYNLSSVVVYYGFDSSITTSTGFPLPASTGQVSLSGYTGNIYAIVASDTAAVRVLSY